MRIDKKLQNSHISHIDVIASQTSNGTNYQDFYVYFKSEDRMMPISTKLDENGKVTFNSEYHIDGSLNEVLNSFLNQLTRQEGQSIKGLLNNGTIKMNSLADKENLDKKYFQEISNIRSLREKDTQVKVVAKEKKKAHNKTVKIASLLAAVTIFGSAGGCAINKTKTPPGVNSTIDTPSLTDEYYNTAFEEMLAKLPEDSIKKEAFTQMMELAKTSNFSADQILTMYMTYNKFTDQEIVELFDDSKYEFNVEDFNNSNLSTIESLINNKYPGDLALLLRDEQDQQVYKTNIARYKQLLDAYRADSVSNEFRNVATQFIDELEKTFKIQEVSDSKKSGFTDIRPEISSGYMPSLNVISAANEVASRRLSDIKITADMKDVIDWSNLCKKATIQAEEVNDVLQMYHLVKLNAATQTANTVSSETTSGEENANAKEDVAFADIYSAFESYVEELHKSNIDNREDISATYIEEASKYYHFLEEAMSKKPVNSGKQENVNIKLDEKGLNEYLNTLPEEVQKDIQNQIEAGKKEIDDDFKQQTEENKQKAEEENDRLQEEEDKKYEEERQEKEDEVNDFNDNIGRDDIVWDEDTTEEDKKDPIYDKDGNEIFPYEPPVGGGSAGNERGNTTSEPVSSEVEVPETVSADSIKPISDQYVEEIVNQYFAEQSTYEDANANVKTYK